nr:SMC family ATPase [Chloroflexota bacterium]
MIPVRLRLQNFMCYRHPTPLDFTGIHLACLAGDNGHGKSAILDAMTWALWGRARARSDDELITLGQKEMEVEFEFQLGNVLYRVIRKRELRRRSVLELQVRDDGQFRPLTASTQRETQARINEILRMDYDTFINSALLLQGRADEFTLKQPAERKRVLADILGLSIYDEYEQQAKNLAKEKEQAEREIGARIQELQRELEHRPEYERELAQAQEELAQLSSQARAAEATLQELRDQIKTREAQKSQLNEVNDRIAAAESQLRDIEEQIQVLDQRIAADEAIIARQAEIERGYAQLLEAREKEAEYNVKLSQLFSLNEEKNRLEKHIAEAKRELEFKKHGIEQRVADLQKLAQQYAALTQEHAQVCQELEKLAALQAQAEAGKRLLRELSAEIAALNAANAQLKIEMAALKEKVRLLQEPTATCPLCGQNLAEEDRLRLLDEFKEQGTQQGSLYRTNKARLVELNARTKSTEDELERIERELRRLPALQGREATLRKSMQEAQEAATNVQTQQQELLALEQQLARGDFAREEQAQLLAFQKRIAELGYDKTAHEKARQLVESLGAFEKDKVELERAQQSIIQLHGNHQRLAKAREQWAASLEADRQRQAELLSAMAGLEELAQRLDAMQREADELRSKEGDARQLVGAAQQKLDYCRYLARERQARLQQLKEVADERSVYEELQLAFGKKGLQALIIETAIPEIEDEANSLLRRMTDGRMSLQLTTQRDTKSGTTIETLDIQISDENGPRNYELYSGGEAFRINFALRIALSKLLARRAGAQLQTLIIDEGFGTQDVEGRQRLVEAINAIKDDFARIIVITHIEELKDAFPVRIDVYKTLQGSQIAIT